MGLATGSTPLPLYRELIAREQAGIIDFSRVRSANLDEYKGLSPDHPQSYRRFMQENLFDHISIKPENTIVPDGLAADIPAMCEAYERQIEDGAAWTFSYSASAMTATSASTSPATISPS